MRNIQLLDELDELTTCHEVVAEMLGATPEGLCSTQKLAVLLSYLQAQQRLLIEKLPQN